MAALEAGVDRAQVDGFAEQHLAGVDILVNAAGLPTATSTDFAAMLGANAQLPLFLARAAHAAGVKRMVHVSSAAVQGRQRLDETETLRPENPYALSKALGERLLREEDGPEIVRYRPTSVHGPHRQVTRALMRIAESPVAAMAAPGDDPSPQVPVNRVAQAVALLADLAESPGPVVLHPWEGATTRSVLADLGGKEPYALNRKTAEIAVAGAYSAARFSGRLLGQARRLDMLLFGQRQLDGWFGARLGDPEVGWLIRMRQHVLAGREPRS